jgi:hypothetical protein
LATVLEKLSLQSSGPWTETDDLFTFPAKSISEKEICEPMMDILISQAPNQPFVFRHRHPAGTDKKVVPIFGRIGNARKERLQIGDATVSKNESDTRLFMVCEFNVPLKSPLGHELPHNRVFADWVKESYEAGDPVGISLAFLKYYEEVNEKKQAYWVDLYEASGTHIPKCVDCTHIEGGVAMSANEDVDGNKPEEENGSKVEQEKYKELEAKLEAMTLEKTTLEDQIRDLENGKETLENALKEKDGAHKLLMEQITNLSSTVNALEGRVDYAETKKPIVDRLVKYEKRPELEGLYREQTLEYLEGEIAKHEGAQEAIVDESDMAGRYIASMKKQMELKDEPEREKLEKNIDPTLLPMMREFWKNGGK